MKTRSRPIECQAKLLILVNHCLRYDFSSTLSLAWSCHSGWHLLEDFTALNLLDNAVDEEVLLIYLP